MFEQRAFDAERRMQKGEKMKKKKKKKIEVIPTKKPQVYA